MSIVSLFAGDLSNYLTIYYIKLYKYVDIQKRMNYYKNITDEVSSLTSQPIPKDAKTRNDGGEQIGGLEKHINQDNNGKNMPRYKTMESLKKNNPVLYRMIQSIYLLYIYQRDTRPASSCFAMLSAEFIVDNYEYVLSLKIEKGEMLKDFRRRKCKANYWNTVSSATLEKMLK
jgi:hypothetical protein